METTLRIPLLMSFLLLLAGARGYAQYCVPTLPSFGGCEYGDQINNFVLTGENGTAFNDLNTGCSTDAYDDRTAQPAVDLLQETTYTTTISTDYENGNYAAIWIDFDDDEVFSSTERVGFSASEAYVDVGAGGPLPITIPAGAAPGNHRMRVMMAYYFALEEMESGADIDPCNVGDFQTTYFEVHDYTVNIVAPNTCTGAPQAGITQASTSEIICTGFANLSLQDVDTQIDLSFQWQSSPDGSTWTNLPGTTPTFTATGIGSTTYFRCEVGCPTFDTSSFSTPVMVTVNLDETPVIDLGNDTLICLGDAVTLDAGHPGLAHVWTNGDTTQTLLISASGTYEVLITSPNGCVGSDAFILTVQQPPSTEGFSFVPMFYEELGKVKFEPLNPIDVVAYEWDFGDGTPIATEMSPLHTYATNADYTVTLHVIGNCGEHSTSQLIYVDHVTGITTPGTGNAGLKLYPNPATQTIYIDVGNKEMLMEHITVFNAVGSAVYQQKSGQPAQHQLSVRDLPSGIYMLRVLTNKGYVMRKFEVIH